MGFKRTFAVMLRSAFGAFEALLGGNAAQIRTVGSSGGRRVWMGRAYTGPPAAQWQQTALMSQLRGSRSTLARTRFSQLKTRLPRPKRSFHSTRPRRAEGTKNGNTAGEESLSLSARLKKLSKEYGWTSVGVYFALSVLDFPFCFLLVRTVGTERIGKSPAGCVPST